MVLGVWGVWRKCGGGEILFGLYLWEWVVLHGNVEKHDNFGIDFYALTM